MWNALVYILLGGLPAALLASDEHRPKWKREDRSQRQLEYQISHHYTGPSSYRLERRISTGPQNPVLYPPLPPPYHPGAPARPYRKGRPHHSYPIPPYAVQMEPLVHYSQRDPFYDNNIFSINADPTIDLANDDLLTGNTDHLLQENQLYGPQNPQVIERPVYIKEPEPIIEIIIKESNVTLPPLPTTPPLKKKKEQVQVFYVKYKKNPNGQGKDSVIYDKPVPAISPKIPDEDEEEKLTYNYQPEAVTAPPPPTTTLRTIIRPDSETYHSASGVKVTFGKESFDYDKRSSKPDDYSQQHQKIQQPQQPQFHQGRQLTSYSNAYFKRPFTSQFPARSYVGYRPEVRQPQPYKPFNFLPTQPSLTQNNYKSFERPLAQIPQQQPPSQHKYTFPASPSHQSKEPGFQFSPPRATLPQYSHSISHPPPPNFQSSRPLARQPVSYKPFENLRQSSSFIPPQNQPLPNIRQQIQFRPESEFRPETHFPSHQQLPLAQQTITFNTARLNQNEQFSQSSPQAPKQLFPQQSLRHAHFQTQLNKSPQIHQPSQQQPQSFVPQLQQQITQNENPNNYPTAQNNIPPEGQLIEAVPKYEQHFSIVEPLNGGHEQHQSSKTQSKLSPQEYHEKILQQFNHDVSSEQRYSLEQQVGNSENQNQQQPFRTQQQSLNSESNAQPLIYTTPKTSQVFEATRRTTELVSTSPRIKYQTTTFKPTTTLVPESPSTTTKDPKILEAQLPDEVPDDLKEQLLSSGILNNADISILDYDKLGDTPLSALPPDQLANFYDAGGATQLAGSETKLSIVEKDGTKVEERFTKEGEDQEIESTEVQQVTAVNPLSGVEMKVVHYNPDTDNGLQIQKSYINSEAQQVEPVILNDNTFNRYLPIKINGTQFPIPVLPELKGKKISSVVVLAPVAYDFSSSRNSRDISSEVDQVKFIQNNALKQLLANPTFENYKMFLEKENKTRSNKQSVILLVTESKDTKFNKEKEIFMYDIATKSVSKLSGGLSSAFVEAAEANSFEDSSEKKHAADASNLVESRIRYKDTDRNKYNLHENVSDLNESDFVESKVPLIDQSGEKYNDLAASQHLKSFVDVFGIKLSNQDLNLASSKNNKVLTSSEYSKTDQL